MWTSYDTTVAVVDSGLVKAKKVGETTIKVTTIDGAKSAECKVAVSDDIREFISVKYTGGSSMSLNGVIQNGSTFNWFIYNNSPVSITLTSLQLYDNASGSLGSTMSLSDVELSAGNNTGWTVTVGAAGIKDPYVVIRYKYKETEYIVSASPDIHGTTPIPVQSMKFSQKKFELESGDCVRLKPLFTPEVSYSLNVQWKSDHPEVASVDKYGNVSALSKGVASITASIDGDISAKCNVWVDSIPDHEYVDLGLSVNWATYNVGAEAPEEFGDYYAWGEIETKSYYDASTYVFRESGNDYGDIKFTKYNVSNSRGQVDNKTELDPEDDVAHVLWGGDWWMPSKAEQEELIDNCTIEWTTVNSVKGLKFTSKKTGYTDKYIFIPAAGYNSLSNKGYEKGTRVLCWSRNLETEEVCTSYYLDREEDKLGVVGGIRYFGKSIRPVCKKQYVDMTGIKMKTDSLYLPEDFETRIHISFVPQNASYREIIWSTSDTTVAKVDENGWVNTINEGKCVITVQTVDGQLTASCIIEVYGTYTYNVTLPPDNEIWYTSVDGNVVELSSYPATLVSNTYNNGRGVYTFASNVTSIGGFIGNDRIESVILPKTVTRLGSYSLHMLNYAHTLVLSPNITSIDTDVFGRLGEGLSEDHINHIYFLSEQCPSPGWRAFWNLNGIVKIHYPKGADYSVIEQAAKEWGDANNKFKWEMVETKYIYNQ